MEGIAAVTGVLSVLAKPLKTTMRNYYVYNAIGYAWRFIFGSGLAYITANSVGEGRFVARNPVVKELVKKKGYRRPKSTASQSTTLHWPRKSLASSSSRTIWRLDIS